MTDAPIQSIVYQSCAVVTVKTQVRLFLEHVLRAVSSDGNYDRVSPRHMSLRLQHSPSPVMAEPKCPRTGARVLLSSRFTHICALI